ncbi:aminoacetone oxidase family FAD-binding enzyme (plasmid) [Sulfurimonas lithotrophica]|uniref:Aminoacetone oxidase family FAD-binding enzyme n=1 Tax=Sulfurimonas lithotrophica TaxID=2590022 RepID=A0A5P8P447_9BACT|nr:aminoacetone oxidase family FAD-binding enzyme [Sulfurimonas lithotrophica]QFR49954.1 aminoacetone oxidase family FAD-binding enzyme [Sulfurimonas lithotrophica]QFR50515.1 aminoacetone oxidase family FAD-binding enzyme [Sulfurimonas lithotrophica]QFR50533.1 aminoacetone oxidase family FAD-binding enzyme [Sulfurimonas lithotrophica]
MKIYDIVILGGGASSLMCAAHLNKSLNVAIIDANDKLAKKLKISGGGKCNITNKYVDVRNFDGDADLVKSVLERFDRDDMLQFLSNNKIELELRKNRYYFCKKSSDDIINVLKKKSSFAKVHLNTKVLDVKKSDEIFEINTDKGVFKTNSLVVATGGESFKNIGASDIGLQIAKSFDIEVKNFTPALAGLTVQKEQFWMKELSGLSCYVNIKVNDRVIKEEMLFAHKGISGPAVLSASLYWRKGDISIDFLPNENIPDLIKGSKKLISSVIPLPKRLSKALLEAIYVKDTECKKVDAKTKEKLLRLHNYSFAPAGNFGFSKAEVSKGGIISNELNFVTFESKKVKKLYFIGEVVDVTGELGGYNFQWAFGSGMICAKNINYN